MSKRQKVRKHMRWLARRFGYNGMLSMLCLVQNSKHRMNIYIRHAPVEFEAGMFFDGWIFKES